MFSSLKARYQTVREDGFTLTELVVAVTILGILLAIALPVFLTAQKHVSALDVKTGLIQAASLIEAEKGDNNQLYPVYMPSEILSDSLWKTFAYTYSDDRLSYCLQGRDSDGGKWFVSSASRTPSSLNCGLPNVAKNSETPWQIQFPAVDVSTYNVEWKANSANPNGSVTWVDAQCNEGTTSYQLHIVNSSQGIDTKVPTNAQIIANNAGLTTNSYSPNLAGWLPDDQTTVSVAAVCTVSTGGRLYTFPGPETGATKSFKVPQFPVAASSYASAPNSYYVENADKSLTMKVDATFTPLNNCPTLTSGINGTNHPVYKLVAKQGNNVVGKKNYSTSNSITLTLSNFTPDSGIEYYGFSYCEFQRTSGATSRYSGTETNSDDNDTELNNSKNGHSEIKSLFTPVGFPTAPGTPTTVSTNGGSVKPDGLTWTAPQNRPSGAVCAYGGTIQYSYVQSSPGSSASTYSAATASGRIDWAQATTYKYYVNAKCVGQSRTSDVTSSGTLTFTTSVIPTGATWQTQYSTDYSDGRLLARGSLNPVSCSGGEARYRVQALQDGENAVVYDGTDRSPTLVLNGTNNPNYGYDGDKRTTFSAYGYCRVTQWDNSIADWKAAQQDSSVISVPANPTNCNGGCPEMDRPEYRDVGNNPEVLPNSIYWDSDKSVTCPNGGSMQYQYAQVYPGNYTSNWQTNNWVDYVGFNPGSYYQYKIYYRCVGTYASQTLLSNISDFTARYNTPNTPGNPTSVQLNNDGYANVTDADRLLWASVGCDRGSTPYYIVRQVRTGDNYRDPNAGGWNGTDWFTNTYFDIPSGWLRQGSKQGYQVIAQCRNGNGTSGNSGWSGEASWTHNIDQPGSTGLNLNYDRYTYWGGVGCGQGASAQYLWQQYNHNEGTTGYPYPFDKGWGVYYNADVDGYNGYAQGVRVYTRCAGDNAQSGASESNHIDYRIPVKQPRLQLDCKPGSSTKYGNSGASCDGKKVAFNPGCGAADRANYAWNGSSQAGSGVRVTGASANSGANNGSNGAFQRTGSGSTPTSWGTGYTAYIENSYCQAGNGQNSAGQSWSVNSGTAGGTWNTGNYF